MRLNNPEALKNTCVPLLVEPPDKVIRVYGMGSSPVTFETSNGITRAYIEKSRGMLKAFDNTLEAERYLGLKDPEKGKAPTRTDYRLGDIAEIYHQSVYEEVSSHLEALFDRFALPTHLPESPAESRRLLAS